MNYQPWERITQRRLRTWRRGVTATSLALLLAACGNHAEVVIAPGGSAKDSALARRVLTLQIRSLGLSLGSLRALHEPRSDTAPCGPGVGKPARAGSPVLYDKRADEFSVVDAVFPNDVSARRAVRSEGGKADESCRARDFSNERRRYNLGPATLSVPKIVRAGNAALATEISVPYTYQGQHGVWRFDAVVVSQGRVTTAIASASAKSILGYDIEMARKFAKDAKAEQPATRRHR
jgi:hypothetical protein